MIKISKLISFLMIVSCCLGILFCSSAQSDDYSFVTKWGSLGSGDSQFNNPYGIAEDSSGNVYVAEYNNHRIQKFALSQNTTSTVPTSTTTTTPTGSPQCSNDLNFLVSGAGSSVVNGIYSATNTISNGCPIYRYSASQLNNLYLQFNQVQWEIVDQNNNVYYYAPCLNPTCLDWISGEFGVAPAPTVYWSPTTTTTAAISTTTTTINDGCPPETPINCGNYCCPQFKPYCGTGLRSGKCLSRPGLCPANYLADGDPNALAILRDFRDNVLANTSTGRDYIRLFYKHSLELLLIFMTDPALKTQSENLLYRILPNIEYGLTSYEITIDKNDLEEVDYLLDFATTKATPALRAVITRLKMDLRNPEVLKSIGKNQQ